MKFKVNLVPPMIMSFKSDMASSIFPPNVKNITVEIAEPQCPFCKHILENANCSCQEFREALKRFKINNYGTEKINVRAYEIKMVVSYMFEPKQVKVSKAPTEMYSVLFPQLIVGNSFNLMMCGTWLLTKASFEDKKLKFYFIKKGDVTIYECSISLPDFKPRQYTDVEVYRMEEYYENRELSPRRLGGYMIKYKTNVIATLGYSEFLQKLQKD